MRRHLARLLLVPVLACPLITQDATPAEAEALVKEPKTSYIEVWNGCIFGAGIHKK
jgi:hypothetical protein